MSYHVTYEIYSLQIHCKLCEIEKTKMKYSVLEYLSYDVLEIRNKLNATLLKSIEINKN